MNFMGLGFSFGSKDVGLDSGLKGIENQFKKLDDVIKGFKTSAAESFSPIESFVSGLKDKLSSFQRDVGGGVDLGDALKVGEEGSKATETVGGLGNAVRGLSKRVKGFIPTFGGAANFVLSGAGKMTGALGWVGMAIGPILTGFGSITDAAGRMVDAVAGLPGRAGDAIHRIANEGINLTNSLEAEATAIGTSVRAIGGNLGRMGQDLSRFTGRATGLAMGLNVGASEAAEGLHAMEVAGSELAEMGFESARSFVQFTAALGVNATMLRNAALGMRNLFGEANVGMIGEVTSAITFMGQETEDVAGALNELPQIMQLLRSRAALGDTPEQMRDFAVGTAAASRGLFTVIQDAGRVREISQTLAQAMTQGTREYQDMFAGVQDQLPELLTRLSIVGGEVDRAFATMGQSPAQFLESFGTMVQQARLQGRNVGHLLNFMRGHMSQVFGADNTEDMITFWQRMDSSTVAAMDSVRGATVNLGEMGAQIHRTGRTAQEVFERMRAGFQTVMRRIARDDVRNFLRDTRESLQGLRVAMTEAARTSGPFSEVVGLLSRTQQLGALALLPAGLRGSAIAADELRGQIRPLVDAFTTWGGVVDTVLAGISIFATRVITTFGSLSRRAREAGEELNVMEGLGIALDKESIRFADILVGYIDDIENFVFQAVNAFAALDWSKLFETGEDGEGPKGVMGALKRVLDRLGDIDWSSIWGLFRKGLEKLFEHIRPWLEEKVTQLRTVVTDRIKEWWQGIKWAEVFGEIGDLAGGLWDAFQPALSELASMIGRWFSDNWSSILVWSTVALAAAVVAVFAGAMALGLGAIAGFFVAPFVLGVAVVKEVVDGFGEDIGMFWEEMVNVAEQYISDIVDFWSESWQGMESAVSDAGTGIETAWSDVGDFYAELWADISDTASDVWEGIKNTAGEFVDWIKSSVDGFVNWFRNTFPKTTQAIEDAISFWTGRFEMFLGFVTETWSRLTENTVTAILWLNENVLQPFFSWMGEKWDLVATTVVGVWTRIKEGVAEGLNWLQENVFQPFFSALSLAWDRIGEVASRLWEGMASVATTVWEGITEAPTKIQQAWQSIIGVLQPIFQQISAFLQPVVGMFNRLAEVGTGVLDTIMSHAVGLFGSSINTVVGEDMAQTEEVMTETAQRVSDVMQSVLHDATVRAIVDGFSEGFNQVVENMDDFSDRMLEAFRDLSSGILEITSNLFSTVIDQSVDSLIATGVAVEGIIGRLRTLTIAQSRLAAARSEAVSELSRPADEEAMRRRMAQLESSPVLQAIHFPDWWTGHGHRGGYRDLFEAKMNELIVTVQGLQTAPVGGTVEERVRTLRSIQAEVRRAGVGGHTGVPGGPGR